MPVADTLFGLPLSLDADEAAVLARVDAAFSGHGSLITFVNPHAWGLAGGDADYAALLRDMDLVLADGIGVAKAAAWAVKRPLPRMSFDASSLYLPVMRRLEALQGGLFVVGAKPGVAAAAVARMRASFPRIAYLGVLDGYRPHEEAIDAILEARPQMVLCGMGAPHQERFIDRLRARGFTGVAFTCGGFLDQLAEAERYYPAWVDRFEARALYRLCREPRRLWRRYLVEYAPFLRLALGARLRLSLGLTPSAPLAASPHQPRA